MKALLHILLLSWLAANTTAGCGEPGVLHNADFNVWCGDKLCNWTIEEGSVKRVATWHKNDYGAALLDAPVVLSQVITTDGNVFGCSELSVVADISEGTEVFFELDFFNKGVIDYSQQLPVAHYTAHTFDIYPPNGIKEARVAFRKATQGTAILARVELVASACEGEPIVVLERPVGAFCEEAGECTSGSCGSGTCD